MNRILLISENKKESEPLADDLTQENFECDFAGMSSKSVLERAVKKIPDLALFNFKLLPDPKGSSAHRVLKEEKELRDIPIMFLVPKGSESQIDFAIGLDDFMTKPYVFSELLARLRLILWKHRSISGKDTIHHGKLLINLEKYEVSLNGGSLTLTFKEYELLKFLATHPGKVFTRDAILNKVWGYDYYGGTRTVDVHIRRLRSKLESGPRPHVFLETVRGVGYKFVGEDANGYST